MKIYKSLAESIYDFSVHRINRIELYEIVCNCILESTPDDKEQILVKKEVGQTEYEYAKLWLHKK